MPKLLHLIPTLEMGGAERQLLLLAREQVAQGWDVHIGLRRLGFYNDTLQSDGVTIHMLGDHRGFNLLLIIKIYSLLRRIRPDVVQSWLQQMDLVAGPAAILHGVPWIISERSSARAYRNIGLRLKIRCLLARFAARIVVNSAGGGDYWRDVLGAGAKISKIGNAVDIAAIREALTCDTQQPLSDRNNFLVIGRLAAEKSLEMIIEAVACVPEKYQFHISIIGDGPLQIELTQEIKNRGLGKRVSIQPARKDWWVLLKSAWGLISASQFEGHPNVVLEALVADCPLIVSDIPAHREFLSEDTAILVPVNSSAALGEAIISVLSDRPRAERRAKRASSDISALKIAWVAGAYGAVYEAAMSKGRL